jgi:hypothetical protein
MKNASKTDHSLHLRGYETLVFWAVSRGTLRGELGQIQAETEKIDQGLNWIGILRNDVA